MEIKGIDVSAYQGKIDWETVADYGMGFAIAAGKQPDAGGGYRVCVRL